MTSTCPFQEASCSGVNPSVRLDSHPCDDQLHLPLVVINPIYFEDNQVFYLMVLLQSLRRIPSLIHRISTKPPLHSSLQFSTMSTPPPSIIKITPLPRSLYPTPINTNPATSRTQTSAQTQTGIPSPALSNISMTAPSQPSDPTTAATSLFPFRPRSMLSLDLTSSFLFRTKDHDRHRYDAQELARNEHLTKYFVQDLNVKPALEEVESDSMDGWMCLRR